MTGELLWQVLLTMKVPEENVEALAHDLYFARPKPSSKGAAVVIALASRLYTDPGFTYVAINTDPGKATLEGLGSDLKGMTRWLATKETTRIYLEKIAKRIAIIKGSPVVAPMGMSPASKVPAAKVPAAKVLAAGGFVAKVPAAKVPATKAKAPAPTKALARQMVQKTDSGPSSSPTKSIVLLVLGGIVYFLVGFSRYASLPKALKFSRKTA